VSEEEIEPELKIRTSDGRVVTERKLNFRVVREEWNEYELEDGTRLYVKLVLADVVRRNELSPIVIYLTSLKRKE